MRYAELIGEVPLSDLKRAAQSLSKFAGARFDRRDSFGSAAKKEWLVNSLLAFLQKPENLARLWQGLSEDEKTALKAVYFGADRTGLKAELALRRLDQLLGGRQRAEAALKALVERWLVFPFKDYWRGVYYILPEEVAALLYHLAAGELKPEGVDPAKVEAVEDHEEAFLADLYTLLAAPLAQTLNVTLNGRIYRRAQKKIRSYFTPYDREERYELLERMAWEFGLLGEDNGRAVLTPKAWEWAAKPVAEQWLEVAAWVLNDFAEENMHLWFMHLVHLLLLFPAEAFLPLEAVIQLCSRYWHSPGTGEIKEEINACADRLLWLGCLESGRCGKKRVVRMKPAGRRLLLGEKEPFQAAPREEKFVVQPNFEVIAGRELAPQVLWQLHLCADLVQADRMLIFNLNRGSFYRAFQAGRKPEEIAAFFKQHSKYELPQNVVFSLEEWQREMGRVYLVQAAVLRCDSPELAAELKASPRLRRYVVGEITAQDLLVPSEAVQQVLLVLQQEGYLPLPKVITPKMQVG